MIQPFIPFTMVDHKTAEKISDIEFFELSCKPSAGEIISYHRESFKRDFLVKNIGHELRRRVQNGPPFTHTIILTVEEIVPQLESQT